MFLIIVFLGFVGVLGCVLLGIVGVANCCFFRFVGVPHCSFPGLSVFMVVLS